MLAGLEYIPKGSKLLVALSGGVDSMSLFHLLYDAKEHYDFELLAVYVNHGLRAEAVEEVRYLEAYVSGLGVPFYKECIDVAILAKKEKLSIEAAAHKLRFEVFARLMETHDIDILALGHTKNDRAESFMMNLLYGSGLDGLSTMPLFENNIWRPLIWTDKKDLYLYSEKRGFRYFHDATNDENIYQRNIIRHEILPFLERYDSAIQAKLAMTSERLYESKKSLQLVAKEKLDELLIKKEGVYFLPKDRLNEYPTGLKKELIKALLKEALPEFRGFSQKRWDAFLPLLLQNETKYIFVRANWWFKIDRKWLSLKEMTQKNEPATNTLIQWQSGVLKLPSGTLHYAKAVDDTLNTCAFLHSDFLVRYKKPKDKVVIQGLGRKSVKKLFQEKGIPVYLRNLWPIVEVDGEIVWIPMLYQAEKNRTITDSLFVLQWTCKDTEEEYHAK